MSNLASDYPNQNDPENIAPLLQRLEELEKKCRELALQNSQLLDNSLRELAGGHLENIVLHHEVTLQYLCHSDSGVRRAAIHLTADYIDKYISVFQDVIASDITDVRETALLAIGRCYKSTQSSTIGLMLARIVQDGAAEQSIRIHAYYALMRVHGPTNLLTIKTRYIETLADIDWALVNEYLESDDQSIEDNLD
jgi:hypothetical protein